MQGRITVVIVSSCAQYYYLFTFLSIKQLFESVTNCTIVIVTTLINKQIHTF